MSDRLLDKPVYVTNGRYLTLEISSIHEALMFLHEWPEDDRDLIYETAWKACCDAHDNVNPIIAAQNVIKGFTAVSYVIITSVFSSIIHTINLILKVSIKNLCGYTPFNRRVNFRLF